jgi:hypothetical protein
MFDARPSAPPAPLPVGNYIQPNLGHGLRIWWAFYWPTTPIATALSVGLHVALRYIYENTSAPGSLIGPIMKFAVYFFTYAVALFGMYYILRKNFRQFRVGQLSNHGGRGAQVLKLNFRRTLRVWWTYSWRTLFTPFSVG